MAKDVQWVEAQIAPVGVNESVDSRVLPDGQLLESYNCEFSTKEGSVRKRNGLFKIATPPEDHSFKRIAVHEQNNQVLAVDLDGTSNESPALYTVQETDASLRKVSFVTNALVEKTPIATDLQSDIISDVAYNNGFLVYGMVHIQTGKTWVKVVETIGSNPEMPGNTVFEQEIDYQSVLDPDFGHAFWVRAAPASSGGNHHVMVTWQCLGLPEIFEGCVWGIVIDVSTSVPVIIQDVTFIDHCWASKLYEDNPYLSTPAGTPTDANFHDTCESTTTTGIGSTNWFIVLKDVDLLTGNLKVLRVDSSLVVDWEDQQGVESFAMSILERNGIVWVNWYDLNGMGAEAWYAATWDAAAGTPDLAPTTWCAAADIGADEITGEDWISGIAPTESSSHMMFFHSQGHLPFVNEPRGFARRAITRWRRIQTNGGLGGLREKRGPRLLSKPWMDPTTQGWYQAWTSVEVITELTNIFPFGGTESNTGIPSYARTAVLFRFCEAGQIQDEAERHMAMPLSAIAGLSLAKQLDYGLDAFVNDEYLVQCPASVTNVHPDRFNEAEALGYRTAFNLRYVTGEEKSGPWDIGVRWYENENYPAGYGRYTSVKYGGSTYFAGGLLTQWDGDRHHEAGFIVQPNINYNHIEEPADPNDEGDWGEEWIGQSVFYQALYETVSENGERIRSATSAVVKVTLGGTPDSGGGATLPVDYVALYLEPHTITMRNIGPLQDVQGFDNPRTLVTIYRSIVPNGTELHRIWQFDVNRWDDFVTDPDQLDTILWVDPGSESDYYNEIEETEVIYTDSGELDNDIPFGGCTSIAVHKERIWVSSGDDPEILWYSKERAEGRPAEFSLFQQIRIPGNKIVAVSSVGEGLLVLCEHSVFSVIGDGPNSTGDPSSGTFQLIPISYQNGCLSSSSVVKTPLGVIFRAEPGYFLCNGRELVFIGKAIQDSADRVDVPISSGVVSDWMQARWCTGVRADYGSETLVFDWDANKWSVWYHNLLDADLAALHIVGVVQLRDRIFHLGSDGSVYTEEDGLFADDGNAYRQSVKFGWLSFGRVQGHKRMRRMGILLSPNPWEAETDGAFGLTVNMDFNYAESGFSSSKFWNSNELDSILAQDGITWLRVHLPYQKQPSIRPEIVEKQPILSLTATDTAATVNTTGASNLRIRSVSGGSWTDITVTTGSSVTKVQIAADLNDIFQGTSMGLEATVDGTNRIVIETTTAEYLEIDSVANGSTLNSIIGFNVLGVLGEFLIIPQNQSGFVLQGLSFDIGMIPGLRRLPAGQSR